MYTLHRDLWCCLGRLCLLYCLRPHFDVTTPTGESVSATIVMSFATGIVACFFCSSIGASSDIIMVMLSSIPLPSSAAGADWSGTILRSLVNISWMLPSLCVVPSQRILPENPAMFWTISNQVRICKSPICTTREITYWTIITFYERS